MTGVVAWLIFLLKSPLFQGTASLITIIGLPIAFYQIRDAKRQTKLLSGVVDGLSTQLLGEFPDYLEDVAKLIKEAKKNVKIVAVVASHGEYSAEIHWNHVEAALKDKLVEQSNNIDTNRFEAILLFPTRPAFMEHFGRHHSGLEITESNDQQWNNWRKEEIESGRFGRLFPDRQSDEDLSQITLQDYIEARFERDRRFINEVYRRFKRVKCSEGLPMFCWIIDDEKAVFSIRTEDRFGHYKGAGISTADKRLVEVLVRMFDSYKEKVQDHSVTQPNHWVRVDHTEN